MKKTIRTKQPDAPDEDGFTSDMATRLIREEGNPFKRAKTSIQHIQRLDDTGLQVKLERINTDNGFTDGRTMRKVGSIPSIFLMRPEYKDIVDGDQKAMQKALKRFFLDHPENRVCKNNY